MAQMSQMGYAVILATVLTFWAPNVAGFASFYIAGIRLIASAEELSRDTHQRLH
jgi:hypothetical protein